MSAPLKSFSADLLNVRVFKTSKELAIDAAQSAHKILKDAIATQGSARAILATGNSQLEFLTELVRIGDLDWACVTLFHMDEYLGISADHPASFRKYMRERVESKLKPRTFHYMEGDALEPIAECDRYAKLLQAQPIDLCCLGIGENGHLAFNDPPVANFNDTRAVKVVKLDESCRKQQVGEGHFKDIDSMPQYALTLTIPALCAAKKMLCITPEKRKANAVKGCITGPINTNCPATFLRKQAHCTLLLDAESGSLI